MSLANGSIQKLVEGLPSDTLLFYLVATLETEKLSKTLQEDVSEIKAHCILTLPKAQTGGGMAAPRDRWTDANGFTQSTSREKVVGKWQEGDPDVSMGEGRVGHRQQGHHVGLRKVPLLFDTPDHRLAYGMDRPDLATN